MIEPNKIYNMDCLDGMKLIPDCSVNMIFTDLPYGKTKSKWDKIINPELMWKEFDRVAKPSAAVVLFAVPPFDKFLYTTNQDNYRYDWIWQKNKTSGHLNKSIMPMLDYESLMVFYRNAPIYNPVMSKGHSPMNKATTNHKSELYGKGKATTNDAGTTERYPKRILSYDVVNNDDPERIHPNQKPVPLCQYIIRTYTDIGNTVLDATTGSASIPIACVKLDRKFIAFEKDKAIYKAALERVEIETNQIKLFGYKEVEKGA